MRASGAFHCDVFGAGPSGSLTLGVYHRLAFAQIVKAGAFHRRFVEKELLAVTGDEAEAPVGDQFLDRSLWHIVSILS